MAPAPGYRLMIQQATKNASQVSIDIERLQKNSVKRQC
jgi:hypothetical protein